LRLGWVWTTVLLGVVLTFRVEEEEVGLLLMWNRFFALNVGVDGAIDDDVEPNIRKV
jgi:hypothetical protein